VTARLDVLGEEAVGKRVVRILYKLGWPVTFNRCEQTYGIALLCW
jgi:hypothetical protein